MLITILMWGAAALILLAAVALMIRWWLKNKKAEPVELSAEKIISPYKAAMQALSLLSGRTMSDPRVLYFELTLVLRKYIGRTFGTRAAEMTTQEFVKSLNLLDIERELRQEMIRFSTNCDPYKYAGVIPPPETVAQDIRTVEKMVKRIEAMVQEPVEDKEA